MRAWVLGVAMLAGCGDGDPPRAPRVVSTNFAAGPVSPTATLSVVLSAPIDAESVAGNVYLARGEPDRSLERPPPPASARARLVPGVLAVGGDGARLDFTPRRALAPEDRYTLYLGPKLVAGGEQLGRPSALAVETGSLDDAAPILLLDAPDDGAVDVPRNLRAVWLRFSRPVIGAHDVALVGDDGAEVAARVTPGAGGAIALELDQVLGAGQHYAVRAGPDVVDGDKRPVFGDPPGFMTSGEIRSGPIELHGFDVEAADRCVVVRFATDDATWAEACVAERCATDARQSSHELAIAFGDALDGNSLAVEAHAWDETTRPEADRLDAAAAPSPLALALTEVLTRPLGPRPAQQFVELQNFGTQPIALAGLTLHTAAGSNALPSVELPAGGYAVVVPSGYIAGAGGDPPPSAGALVVRLADAQLGGRGIHVAGEPVWIEDALGRVITRWGGWPLALAPGQSVARAAGSCDVAASFQPTPSGGSTPGGP
ncbi:MAG TPA: hypothetical protein VFF06_24075 [Polyangia bacterium]|nr:hypothetical protein [Polyangia bacterium]